MLDCSVIMSLSLVIFSIIVTAWWSFFIAIQNFTSDKYIGTDLAAVIISHTSLWTSYTLGWFFLSFIVASYYLVNSSDAINLLSNLFFIAALPWLAFVVFSQINLVANITKT